MGRERLKETFAFFDYVLIRETWHDTYLGVMKYTMLTQDPNRELRIQKDSLTAKNLILSFEPGTFTSYF